jgi:hypothetical protein
MTDSQKRGERSLLLANNQVELLLIGCSHMVGKSEVHCNGAENIKFEKNVAEKILQHHAPALIAIIGLE